MNAAIFTPLQSRWQALQARERAMLGAALAVVLAALLWWLAVAPALATLRQFDTRSGELDLQVQHMQALRQQARSLQEGQAVGISPAAAMRSLQNATPQLLGKSAQVNVAGDRATVRFQRVAPEAFGQWIAQMREQARATPVQLDIERTERSASANAQASADAKTGAAPLWSGSVVLALAGAVQ